MHRKILTASFVALFCTLFAFLALAGPPDAGPSSSDSVTDAGPTIADNAPDPDDKAPPTVPPGAAESSAFPGGPEEFVQALRSGDWRLVAAFALVAIMIGLRRIRDKVPWLQGDRGGAIAVMLLSLAGAFTTSLSTDAPVDFKMVLGAVAIAWTAVGGYTWVKRLIWPADKPAVSQ